jgi:hypothetical protein
MGMISIALVVIASLSEILPLCGITKANGILHGLHMAVTNIHAASDCKITVETNI